MFCRSVQCSESNHKINIEKAFSGLMKNICWCVLIFTDIVKVSLLAAPCANCALVTLSKSDLQLFILSPKLLTVFSLKTDFAILTSKLNLSVLYVSVSELQHFVSRGKKFLAQPYLVPMCTRLQRKTKLPKINQFSWAKDLSSLLINDQLEGVCIEDISREKTWEVVQTNILQRPGPRYIL